MYVAQISTVLEYVEVRLTSWSGVRLGEEQDIPTVLADFRMWRHRQIT